MYCPFMSNQEKTKECLAGCALATQDQKTQEITCSFKEIATHLWAIRQNTNR